MRILVTGSAGQLGEALMRTLRRTSDRPFVQRCLRGVDAIVHAARLHKPHLATHTRQDFLQRAKSRRRG